HHIFDATLMHGNHVGVPFHQTATVLFYNGLFGKINTVQLVPSVVSFRSGRVDVLRHFVVLFQDTPAKSHYFSRKRMNRKHDAPTETVGEVIVIAFERKPRFYKVFFVVTGFYGRLRKRIALLEAVAKLEFFDYVFAKTTFPKIAESNRLS